MSQKLRLIDLFEENRYHKIILTVSVLAFLMLELLIYLAAASQAGQKSRVIVTDSKGAIKYETAGSSLTSYEKMVFENTFGPLDQYQVTIHTESQPFPFRAWVSAAVGIPVGLVLLVSFVVRVYLTLLYGEEREQDTESASAPGASRFGSVFQLFKRFSIFHVGSFLVVLVLLLWMVPNFIGDFLRISIITIREFKWFFLGASIFIAGLVTWIVFLRYKLSKKMLENQLDLEKFRVEKQLLLQAETPPLLPASMNEAQEHFIPDPPKV